MTTRAPADVEPALRRELIRIGRLLYAKGLIVGLDGNLSARLPDGSLLITPSGLCKGMLDETQLLHLDGAGHPIDRAAPTVEDARGIARLRPSSELAMHLEAYRQRPDIGAVVHAHPTHLVAMSLLPGFLDAGILPEALLYIGRPPVLEYARPASEEGALRVREALRGHDAIVLSRHGSLCLGATLEEAFFKTETLEQLARICGILRAAGQRELGSLRLAPDRVAELLALREALGLVREADATDFAELVDQGA